jgi:hypothetical protein
MILYLDEAPCSKLQCIKQNLPSLKSYGKASCAEVASPCIPAAPMADKSAALRQAAGYSGEGE